MSDNLVTRIEKTSGVLAQDPNNDGAIKSLQAEAHDLSKGLNDAAHGNILNRVMDWSTGDNDGTGAWRRQNAYVDNMNNALKTQGFPDVQVTLDGSIMFPVNTPNGAESVAATKNGVSIYQSPDQGTI